MSKKKKNRPMPEVRVIDLADLIGRPAVVKDAEREKELEKFRQTFREAYPDAAAFIESIHLIHRKPEFRFEVGGLLSEGYISSRGVSPKD